MTDTTDTLTSPGEANTRRRKRREVLTYVFAGTLGGVIGGIIGFADQGEGSLFTGEWEKLALDPAISVVLAIALVLALIAFPLWYFSMIDELVRERNLVGYTGGMMAVMGGVPAWAVLYAGGLAPYPTAAGAWVIGFVATFVAFGFEWLRSR